MKPNTKKILAYTAWGLCLLVAIVLGIKNLREPDIWWQLRTGEWIIRHHTVPYKDIFSFTYAGTPWINVKWGFEVLMQCMAYIGGPEFTPVLQCIADVLVLVFVLKIYNTLKHNVFVGKSKFPSASILFSCLLLLFICAFRFIGRPEMASHVMVVVFLLFVLRHYYSPSKSILWLIPLQILWANLHEAYGTGTVIMITTACAAWVQYYLESKNLMAVRKTVKKTAKSKKAAIEPEIITKTNMPIWLSITAIGVILAPAVTPYGLTMIVHPFNIFAQVESNKFTTELAGYTDPIYWQWESYLNIILFGLGVLFFFLKTPLSNGTKWYFRPVKTYSLAYFILFFLFFYLSLTAYRNIPFFIIVMIPLFAVGIDVVYNFLKKKFAGLGKQGLALFGYGILILVAAVFYVSVTTGKFYNDFEDGRDSYGLKIDANANPIGSADYIRDHHLTGNCFTDFLVSSYLMWDLKPDFKTFIDLRDLDVFPADFFEHVNLLNVEPQLFENIDKVAHFKYAVIFRLQFLALHRYLEASQDWKGVYADPISVVYIKKDSTDPATMKLYNAATYTVPFHAPVIPQNSGIANVVSRIFWPVYNPDYEEKIDIDLYAAAYYRSIGHLDAALASAKKSAQNNIANWDGEDMEGNIYIDLAAKDTAKAQRNNDYALANEAFNNAMSENKKDDAAYMGLGTVSLSTGDAYNAEQWFKQAIKYNPDNYITWWNLANCENDLSESDRTSAMIHLQQRLTYLKKSYDLNQDQRIRFYLGIAYGQTDDCKNCRKYLDENTMRYPGIPSSDKKLAKELLQNCGTD